MGIQAAEISAILKEQIKNFGQDAEVAEVGRVLSVGDGIARIYGLSKVKAGELIEFPSSGVTGMVLNLEEDNVGAVLFGEVNEVKEGDEVRRTNQIASVEVNEGVLGRVLDGLGRPMDGKGPIPGDKLEMPLERKAPSVIYREPVIALGVCEASAIADGLGMLSMCSLCEIGWSRALGTVRVKSVERVMK